MKLRYLKLKNWIFLSLLGALGFNSCNTTKEVKKEPKAPRHPRNEIMLLYGVYTADFEPSGSNVQNEGKPIEKKEEVKEAEEQIPLLYGVPMVEFRLTGRVVDDSGMPIPNAQVVLLDDNFDIENMDGVNPEFWAEYVKHAADTTDAQGGFAVRTRATPFNNSKHVLVRDVDGEKNGSFKDEIVEVKYPEVTNARFGSVGVTEEKTTIKVKLVNKK